MSSILVIGAGELGLSVIESLVSNPARKDTPIAVLLRPSTITSRDPAKIELISHLRDLGIALVPGDIIHNSEAELASIFSKYHTVIGCSGLGFPPDTQLRLSRAVLAAGTPRYFPWQFGVDYDVIGRGSSQDLFDEQLAVRDLLRAQHTTDWVIISVGLFTSFLFVPEFGVVDIKNRVVRALGSWNTTVTLTHAPDIALMTADIALQPGSVSHEVVHIAGDMLSYGEIADKVVRRFGGDWVREEWDTATLTEQLVQKPDDMMVKYRGVFGGDRGISWPVEESENAKRGIVLTSLDKYLETMEE